MDTLEKLTFTVHKLRGLKAELAIVNAQWSTWNYWARQQDGYTEWAYENAIEGKELRAFENKRTEVNLDFEEGAPLLALRRLIWHKKDLCLQELSDCFYRAWATEELPLPDIAKAYGQTQNATYRQITRYPWFEGRYEPRMPVNIKDAPSLRK